MEIALGRNSGLGLVNEAGAGSGAGEFVAGIDRAGGVAYTGVAADFSQMTLPDGIL